MTGTLASTLIEQSFNLPILGISRDWVKQQQITNKYIKLEICDIADINALHRLFRTYCITHIVNTAALKCLHRCEDNPAEAMKVNVIGVQNLYDLCQEFDAKLLQVSTDKSVLACNIYGATKHISEKIVLKNKDNVVTRYGNVWGSRGSVVPIFIKSLLENKSVDITDVNMSRFFITKQEAASFVINSLMNKKGLQVPHMKAALIIDIAHTIAKILSINAFNVNVVGIKPGEKIYEDLISVFERHLGEPMSSRDAPKFTETELTALLTPIVKEHLQ